MTEFDLVLPAEVDVREVGMRDGLQLEAPVPLDAKLEMLEALVATGGRTLQANWTKASESDRVVLTDAHGTPILLAPGNTWVELVPNRTGSVSVG